VQASLKTVQTALTELQATVAAVTPGASTGPVSGAVTGTLTITPGGAA
jgi:hypothetical protein